MTDPDPTVYATADEFTARLDRADLTSSGVDDVLAAASRWVDFECDRRFYADAEVSARSFTAPMSGLLWVPDIADPETVVVATGSFGGPWATWGYAVELGPDSAPPGWVGAWPRNIIGSPLQCWPTTRGNRIQVTALWGCPSVPAPVKQATLILATKLWKRKGSPEGVAGFGEFGVVRIRSVDPDVASMLEPYGLRGT